MRPDNAFVLIDGHTEILNPNLGVDLPHWYHPQVTAFQSIS
ncbi:MAG TPA: hypothetical protein VGW37_00725 [Terriglobia bacterium]|nr:hypothetical protein [Terriglobia bacterium]